MKSLKVQESVKNEQAKTFGINSDWLTRKQACSYIQVGISTLDTSIPLRKYYIGKSVRYLKKDLDELLLANCVEPNIKRKKDNV
jgi:hypothetical protein